MDRPTWTELESADSSGKTGDHIHTGNGGPRDVPIASEEDSDSTSSGIADEEAGGTEHPEDQEEDADDTYDDGEDGEDDDDDEEPTLKYERVGGAVPDLLKKDTASALAVSSKLLVIIPFSSAVR